MSSSARQELQRRLRDVDEIIAAHAAITGGGCGKPAQQQGAAITRAGVVLLAAAMEAYVEDLFEESARLVMQGRTDDELLSLFKNTSRKLNKIAHGKQPGVRLEMLRKWRSVVDKYSKRLDGVLAEYIWRQTSIRPHW